ncbi:MAG: ABC transporter substrate-binding protein [Christensenellales bacterium]|jgi:branched-chain amino acid transport system substrate-binding protein
MKKTLALIILVVFLLSLFAGCASNGEEAAPTEQAAEGAVSTEKSPEASSGENSGLSGEYNIGCHIILTGNNSVFGVTCVDGINLAVKYINEHGGMNGAKVTFEAFDNQSKVEESVKLVQKFIEEDTYDAIIGSHNSADCLATVDLLNAAETLNFGMGTSYSFMENPDNIWTFRAALNGNRQAPMIYDLCAKLGFENIAILNGNDDNAIATADAFQEAVEAGGATIVERQVCDQADTDFSGQISQIIASKPDTVFLSALGAQFGPMIKQFRNQGYTGTISTKDSMQQDFINVAGVENCNYVYYAYPYVTYTDINDITDPYMKEFTELYIEEYGTLPNIEGSYRGWDTMMSLWEASKIAGSNDKEAIREAMDKVKIPGLGGTLDFTNGDREGYSAVSEFIMIDGKSIYVDDWLADGGYEAYLEATGNEK